VMLSERALFELKSCLRWTRGKFVNPEKAWMNGSVIAGIHLYLASPSDRVRSNTNFAVRSCRLAFKNS
jgi:hypothetical protein